MSDKRLFLVSNDDGFFAPGISVVAEKLKTFGEVIVVAPSSESSAVSHGITIRRPLRVHHISESVYSVDGTPADCVIVGIDSILKRKPSWVISGINRGGNLGTDTLYSGTVAAAVEGSLHGCRSMAISLDGYSDVMHYETASYVVEYLLNNLKEDDLDQNCVLNINVPNIPVSELKGVAPAQIGNKVYKDLINHGKDPRGYPYIWIGSICHGYEDMKNSDYELVAQGYASVSILKPTLFNEEATKRLGDML